MLAGLEAAGLRLSMPLHPPSQSPLELFPIREQDPHVPADTSWPIHVLHQGE